MTIVALKHKIPTLLLALMLAFGTCLPLTSCGNADDASSEAANQEQAADQGDEASEEGAESNGDSSGKDSKDAEDDAGASNASGANSQEEASSSSAGASKSPSSTSGGPSKSSDSGSSSAGSSKSSGSSSAGSSASSGSSKSSSSAKKNIKVTVFVDASNAADAGYAATLYRDTITLKKGSTAYDALQATGLAIGGNSTYVSSIGGLAEKQLGKTSGWMYEVNGTTPMTSCGNCKLSDGDTLRWYYVTSYGDN